MAAYDGVGMTSHLIKQDATGDADGTTINLGAAQTGFRTFQTIGDGYVFYWMEWGTSYEYGYGYLDSVADTLTRYATGMIFSSTGTLLAPGATDDVVMSCPANPLGFGLQGAGVTGLSGQSIPNTTETTITFTSGDVNWDSIGGLVGTNKFTLPAWAPAVEVTWIGNLSGLSSPSYVDLSILVGGGALSLSRTTRRHVSGTSDAWVFNTGPFLRQVYADTYKDIVCNVTHDGGSGVTASGDIHVRIIP